MITKAKAHFQGPLLQLQTRFSQVYPEATDESPVNPMAPEHLCSAFTEAIQALEIQIRERLILLKQFDRYVVSNLGMLLDEANRILIQAGIIPNFRYHGKSGQQHEASSPQSAEAPKQESAPDASAAERAGQAASSSAVFEQIRQMLALQRANAGIPPRASDPNVRVVGDSELASLLNSLPLSAPRQDQGNLSAGEPVSVDLRQLVQQLLSQTDTGDGRKPALNEVDEDLINLVSMLFEFILDDYNLSAPVQVLISRLQIPINQCALLKQGQPATAHFMGQFNPGFLNHFQPHPVHKDKAICFINDGGQLAAEVCTIDQSKLDPVTNLDTVNLGNIFRDCSVFQFLLALNGRLVNGRDFLFRRLFRRIL